MWPGASTNSLSPIKASILAAFFHLLFPEGGSLSFIDADKLIYNNITTVYAENGI